MNKIKKLIRKYKRRRDFKRLTEEHKQMIIYLGASPEQLEKKEQENDKNSNIQNQ